METMKEKWIDCVNWIQFVLYYIVFEIAIVIWGVCVFVYACIDMLACLIQEMFEASVGLYKKLYSLAFEEV